MTNAISLTDVVKTFGDTRAVNGLTLDVPSGICMGLLGPNGAGKSTTMRMLTGQAVPDSGTIEVLPDGSTNLLVYNDASHIPLGKQSWVDTVPDFAAPAAR